MNIALIADDNKKKLMENLASLTAISCASTSFTQQLPQAVWLGKLQI